MTPGLVALTLAMETVLTTNKWNFLDVPRGVFHGSESVESDDVSFKVRLEKPARDVVPSWTGSGPVKIWIKPGWESEPWFCLGEWSLTGSKASVDNQKNEHGEVLTDVLRVSQASDRFEVRLEGGKKGLDTFRFVATENGGSVDGGAVRTVAPLPVPLRAQMKYPGGNVLCSPTSVSMVLGYWSEVLVRSELDRDVPEVKSGVWDPVYDGAGNWSFNVAYAGSQPGMTGFVTRLRGLTDAAAWLEAKVPVVCSVSYSLLKGEEKVRPNDGHLVVLVGFDTNGDPVFNDPGRNTVRLTYKRADFERAWSSSGRTVYLIYPEFWRTPKDGPWPSAIE